MSDIFECNVWCEDDEKENLGLPDGDCWMPIAFKLSEIESIKLAGENDFIGKDKAAINFKFRSFIVDVTYTEMVNHWKIK